MRRPSWTASDDEQVDSDRFQADAAAMFAESSFSDNSDSGSATAEIARAKTIAEHWDDANDLARRSRAMDMQGGDGALQHREHHGDPWKVDDRILGVSSVWKVNERFPPGNAPGLHTGAGTRHKSMQRNMQVHAPTVVFDRSQSVAALSGNANARATAAIAAAKEALEVGSVSSKARPAGVNSLLRTSLRYVLQV